MFNWSCLFDYFIQFILYIIIYIIIIIWKCWWEIRIAYPFSLCLTFQLLFNKATLETRKVCCFQLLKGPIIFNCWCLDFSGRFGQVILSHILGRTCKMIAQFLSKSSVIFFLYIFSNFNGFSFTFYRMRRRWGCSTLQNVRKWSTSLIEAQRPKRLRRSRVPLGSYPWG